MSIEETRFTRLGSSERGGDPRWSASSVASPTENRITVV
jgi:hypothetical protein